MSKWAAAQGPDGVPAAGGARAGVELRREEVFSAFQGRR